MANGGHLKPEPKPEQPKPTVEPKGQGSATPPKK